MSAPHVLYRVYDSDNYLLYVGATINPGGRLNSHAGTQPWWTEAARIALQHFTNIDELAAAEVAAIKREKPEYNQIHNGTGWIRGPRRRADETRVFQRGDGMWTGSVELPAGPGGKRRQKRVYSKNRHDAELKLAALKEAVAMGDIV